MPSIEIGGDIIVRFSIFRLPFFWGKFDFTSMVKEGGSSPEAVSGTAWGCGLVIFPTSQGMECHRHFAIAVLALG